MAPVEDCLDTLSGDECVADEVEEPLLPLLELPGKSRERLLAVLEMMEDGQSSHGGVDISFLPGEDLDSEVVERTLNFCSSVLQHGATLRIAHSDLGSGTTCEQRIFELIAARKLKERELAHWREHKKKSSSQKDFSVSARMRREGEEGINTTEARLVQIDEDLEDLDKKKVLTPWHCLFSGLEKQSRNNVRCLDLSNCGLHATGIVMLTQTILELEHRGGSERLAILILDGNNLQDSSMAALASFLRLTSSLEMLRLRNVGITEQGLSEVVAGLVSNKSLALLDVRDNGLCAPKVSQDIVSGMRRFNSLAEILVD
eukprot:TRINITY_DN103503_c0_g1_i1.p1 TRINITY_DN103503_c0_g1~~TRINITY_DN103503_c0_g1_i1.p1  ORF type:complete len:316 (-),score=80.55 TRINITY_DN103503_c0_g1_i1:145-1092(-)